MDRRDLAPPDVEQERRARQALVTRATDSIVALIFDAPRTETLDWGSGTLLQLPSGSCAVLTVEHIFRDRPSGPLPLQLMVEGFKYPIEDAVERVVLAPNRLDAAVAFLRTDVARAVRQVALGADVMADDDDLARLPKENPVLVAGFSHQHRGAVWQEGTGEIRMGVLAYWGNNVGQDDRALSVVFRNGIPTRSIRYGDDAELVEGMKTPLKKPDGLSGGGVFGAGRLPTSVVWSADGALRLLGVPHQFANGRQQAVRVPLLRAWVLEQLATA